MIFKKKTVGIFIFHDAEVLDFAGPFEVFSVTSQLNNFMPFKVFTVAKTKQPIVAVNGLQLLPDYSINDHPHIDVLIVSGGQGTKILLNDIEVLQWIEKIYNASQLTLSICSASRLFGKLGLLDSKEYCTHHEVYKHMAEIAPLAKPQRQKRFVKTDAKLFTSGGISAGIDLSFHAVANLLSPGVARRTADYMEYRLVN